MSAPVQLPFTSQPVAPPKPSRRRRWAKRLLPLAVLLVLAVWFAPAVVAKTQLRNRFARQALADLRGNVDVGSASLGWLSPVELRDVIVTDDAGRPLVRVPKVTSQKTLFALARESREPGEFTVENPTINVVCEKGTTNLETAFAEYLKDGKPASETRTPVGVRVTGGTLTLTDAESGKSANIENVAATVTVPASRSEPLTATLTAATGGIDARVSIGDVSSAKLVAKGFPLDTLAPLLKRAEPGLSVAGALDADVRVTWAKDAAGAQKFGASGTVGAKKLAVGGAVLNGDTLQLDSVELPLDVDVAGRAVQVRKFDLTCDVGTLSVAGAFDPAEASEQLLTRGGIVVGADVELAKLAAKLPKLLRVKDGTELREGKLKIDLASKADGGAVVWTGKLLTSAIKATRDGKPIAWDEPLNVDFVARYAPGTLPTFDKLICTSDFVAVNARTTPATIQIAATVNLSKLGTKLTEFVDLGGFSIAGEATARLGAGRKPDGAFEAVGGVDLTDFAFTDRGRRSLKEPLLKLDVKAAGVMPDSGPVRLSTATLDLIAGGDELHLKLLEPVSDVREISSGVAEVRVSGDVERWKARAAAVTTIPPYQMSGALAVSGKARLATDRVTVDGLTVTLTNVKFRGAGIVLDEPRMTATGDLTLTRATSSATIAKVMLNSAPLTVTEGTLTFESQTTGEVFVTGSGPCVADLNKLGVVVQLYPDARGPDALHGRGVGPLRFRAAGDVTTFGGALTVTDFAYGTKDKPLWAEPTLKLEADGDYRGSTDAVTLAVAKVSRPGLDLDAKGSVKQATSTQDVDFSGTLRYDWNQLTPLIREFVGPSFAATGSGSRPVRVSGQLTPPVPGSGAVAAAPKLELKAPGAPAVSGPSLFATVDGELGVGWDSLKAYGFEIGASEFKGKMTRGVVDVTPLYATFGGGKFTLAPTLKLDRSPFELKLAKGHVFNHAKLTPTATAGALGYALPAIANAGHAEGEISVVVDENTIVLGDYARSNVKGAIVIHKATVSAGPAISEVAKLLGVKNTTMTLASDNVVPVQVINGRVHHQGFAVNLAGTPLRTSGSVGFDDTLDLTVEVPLPKDLPALKNNPVLMKAIAGKPVRIPVKGTLAKPELDPKGFERAVADLAREGAKDAGKDLIEGELKKLFPNVGTPGASPKLPLPIGKKP